MKSSVSCTCRFVSIMSCRLEIGKQSGLSCTVGGTARRCVGYTQIRARISIRRASFSLPCILPRKSQEQQTDSSAPLRVNGEIALSGQGSLKLDGEGRRTSENAGETATIGSWTEDRYCGAACDDQ